MIKKPLVSVVIPTWNSARTLKGCLEAIKKQSYKNIEIIIIDNNSTDETKKIAKEYTNRVYNYGPERSIQRNKGIKEARGEFVLVLDQDMYLTRKVVQACLLQLTQKNLIALVIPEISIGEGFWTKCVILERYVSNVLEDGLNDSCRFFRKKDALKIGGYDSGIVGAEDSDFHYRMKELGKIGKIKEYINHDEGRTRFWNRVKKKYYYSSAFREYLRRRPILAAAQFFPIKPAYFKHSLLLLKQPLVTIGMFTLRSCEVMAGLLGLIFKRD